MTPERKMTVARAAMLLSQPFFGSLTMRLKLVEDEHIPTLATDGELLIYNPNYVETLSISVLQAAVAHEALHVALMHLTRRMERDPERWNRAGDYVINLVLRDANFSLGDGWLIDDAYRNMSTDEVYNKLPKEDGGKGKPGPGQGKGKGHTHGDGKACGGLMEPANGFDGSKRREMEAAVKDAIAQAQGWAPGNMPASLRRLVNEMLDAQVNWREKLRNFMEVVFNSDYSMSHPNRRYLQGGFSLPSLFTKKMGEIAIVVDTSGSIGSADLKAFAGEMTAIVGSVGAEKVHVIYCDARVAATQEFTQDDLPLKLTPKGGGGTDFRPPFEWLVKNGIDPVCLIYLTDLFCSRYPNDPGYPVMWATMTESSHWTKVPFGQVVHIK